MLPSGAQVVSLQVRSSHYPFSHVKSNSFLLYHFWLRSFLYKMPILDLFFFIFGFSVLNSKQMFYFKFCPWLGLNCGSLVSEHLLCQLSHNHFPSLQCNYGLLVSQVGSFKVDQRPCCSLAEWYEDLSFWYNSQTKMVIVREVVVAQLVERSLSIPEVRGLTPDIGKILLNICLLSTVLKRRK